MLASSAVLLAPVRPALATPLGVGGLLFPTPAEADPTGGVVVAGGLPVPFAAGAFSGTLTTVVAGDPSNALGGLTFVYQLSNAITSTNVLERLTVNGYAPFLVDASYQTPAAGILRVRRSPDGGCGWFQLHCSPRPQRTGPREQQRGSGAADERPGFRAELCFSDRRDRRERGVLLPVPEPGSLGAMAVAVVLLVRRRR